MLKDLEILMHMIWSEAVLESEERHIQISFLQQ